MIQGCISNKILREGTICDAENASIPSDAVVIYDVLRVVDGVPLFVEDHSTRFFKSFDLSGRKRPFEEHTFTDSIWQFIKATALQNGNIRCVYSIANTEQFLVYEIAHSYPTTEMYQKGVKCGIFEGERTNPNVKQEASVKTNAYKKIDELGVYEVLLVDSQKNVTEGSKSNTFFVKDGTIITALASDVLCGITRLQIIELIHELQIPLIERKIALQELSTFDAAFISGTSPKVLPIAQVNEVSFCVTNTVVKRLADAYNNKIGEYIKTHKDR